TTTSEPIRQSNQSLLIYEPARAFSLGEYTTPNTQINTINNAALATADLLLVLSFKNSKSWGVPAEVQQAIDQQKPILFVTDLQQHQRGWAAHYNPEQVTLLQFDQNAELNGHGELACRILRAANPKITEQQPTPSNHYLWPKSETANTQNYPPGRTTTTQDWTCTSANQHKSHRESS